MDISKSVRTYLDQHVALRTLTEPILRLRHTALASLSSRRTKALLDLCSNIVGGDVTVQAAGFPGEFAMDFRSHVLRRILVHKFYEPEIAAVVRERLDPSRDVLDVGANVGLFTLLMASLLAPGSRLLAIEPTSHALGFLRRNVGASPFGDKVTIIAGVASDFNGEVTIESVPGNEEYSTIGTIVHSSMADQRGRVSSVVPSRTIDALTVEHKLRPGFMKVDTEGAELLVFSGARETLCKHKPVIVSELVDDLMASRSHSAREVVELLKSLGYNVYDLASMRPISIYPYNGEILAVPVNV